MQKRVRERIRVHKPQRFLVAPKRRFRTLFVRQGGARRVLVALRELHLEAFILLLQHLRLLQGHFAQE
ncbi:hypothetical protein NKT34_23300 [Paenibacillus polysaccharolyticus]|uniref:hypothetical protein n=1 Tax=Paenibacillus polysaccharolyticus TaxID=582692 RepID=UPI00209E24EF|nr:hypothetical protein [Paenibacillus polysaccharolyticus]MCP1136228.1 hypothetical protein [Paenibacillus polysaccharolyticus]